MKITVFLLSVVLFFACERRTDIDFNLPYQAPQYVVYAILSTENKVDISILKTEAVNADTPDFTIDEIFTITMTLPSGEEVMTTTEQGQALLQTPVSEGDFYTICFKSEEVEIRAAPVQIPERVNITDVEVISAPDSSRAEIKFTFSDLPGSGDRYEYLITPFKQGNPIETDQDNLVRRINDEDYVNEEIQIVAEQKTEFPIFTNNEFNGLMRADALLIKLHKLSPEIIRFEESLQNNSAQLGNRFSEQNPPYTNLSEGYGFVGAIAVDSIMIEL